MFEFIEAGESYAIIDCPFEDSRAHTTIHPTPETFSNSSGSIVVVVVVMMMMMMMMMMVVVVVAVKRAGGLGMEGVNHGRPSLRQQQLRLLLRLLLKPLLQIHHHSYYDQCLTFLPQYTKSGMAETSKSWIEGVGIVSHLDLYTLHFMFIIMVDGWLVG